MSSILRLIKEAYAEIAVVMALIDISVNAQKLDYLHNLFDSGQLNIYVYLILVTFQAVILPALPSIALGIIINRIKEALKKDKHCIEHIQTYQRGGG